MSLIGAAVGHRTLVRVDPIRCDGHGLCAGLLPERIRLDEWGYPIISSEPMDADLDAHARRAVAACPALALSRQPAPLPAPRTPARPPTPRSRPTGGPR
ncbi:MAG: ferredoxin [Actinomycetes bacterium]